MESKIREAKRRLYHEIIACPNEELTKNERDIGYLLVFDKDIQDNLTNHVKKEKRKNEK